MPTIISTSLVPAREDPLPTTNDFEVGLRHALPVINVMNEDATINENGGKYAGLNRYEARKQILADLEEQGLLVKVRDHAHNVGTCYRCSDTVEPWASQQWFVKMKPLAEPAIEVVRNGTTKFVPERFDKIYFHWMENIQDRCISRQIWWRHRFPPVLRRLRRSDCGSPNPRHLPQMRQSKTHPGSGHSGHLVLLGVVALLHLGLAGQYR